MPVTKGTESVEADASLGDRTCMLFASTMVTQGQGLAVVTATADQAEIGKINALVSQTEGTKTPILVQLEVLGRFLAVVTIVIAVFSWIIAYVVRDYPASEGASTLIFRVGARTRPQIYEYDVLTTAVAVRDAQSTDCSLITRLAALHIAVSTSSAQVSRWPRASPWP